MLEVEAKIHISRSEYESLQKRLSKEARLLGTKISADTYYAKSDSVFIRIRQNKSKFTFGLKKRETVRGIESNIEMEWGIKDIQRWRSLLSRLKIRPNIRKTKNSTVYKMDGFSIELNHVSRLGYFLEIERLVRDKEGVPEAKNLLIKLFKKLGYSSKQFEPRPYLQLLENV